MIEILPRVLAFIRSQGGTYADVRILMAQAVSSYRQPLAGTDLSSMAASWKYGGEDISWAGSIVNHARYLAKLSGEETHREDSTERKLSLGDRVGGRLGTGDRIMERATDRSTVGAFNDVFYLRLDRPTSLSVSLQASWCTPHLTLTDESGKQLAGNLGGKDGARITKKLPAGVYHIWAGAEGPGELGSFELMVVGEQGLR